MIVQHQILVLTLKDLDALDALDHILISETEGIEKPSPEIFHRACTRAGVDHSQALHVGDELEAYVVLFPRS